LPRPTQIDWNSIASNPAIATWLTLFLFIPDWRPNLNG
jgi:hypothetical protein